ncbi:MAG: hypothetical protein IPM71_10550 [Bacteroidota bacterium]|nr:MAG: hypothetical protein IPM71_10550 [Bacteroidota bacterium]
MKNFETIEDFLDGTLHEDQKEVFKAELKKNEKLAQEAAFVSEVNESIRDEDANSLREQLRHLITQGSKRKHFTRMAIAAAASLVLLFSIVALTSGNKLEKAFNKYYTPYAIDLSTRSAHANQMSGLDLGIQLYANGDYQFAFSMLENYNKEVCNHSIGIFYQALCALELNKPQQAEELLLIIDQEGDYAYSMHAKWYLSLLYLKANKPYLAKPYLNILSSSTNFYTERSEKILSRYF